MKHQLISDLEQFLSFVRSLERLKDDEWFEPLGEGKWSIHDIVTHIMKWDEYFNNVTFPTLTQNKLPELKEHPDYLGFNEQSVSYGKGRTRQEIIEETIRNRQMMISNLSMLEDYKFSAVYPGDREFTLESYIKEFFISHDKHHMNQINQFLMKKQQTQDYFEIESEKSGTI